MSNHFPRHVISTLMVILALLSLCGVMAQDTLKEQPLMQTLARIPNIKESRTEIYFSDRKAVELAYSPAQMPEDWAEFDAMRKANGKNPDLLPVALWWQVWQNQKSPLQETVLQNAQDTPAVVGFDYFQIEQEITYALPYFTTTQLTGNFDLGQVRAAFSERGYHRQDNPEGELWCPENICDEGERQTLSTTNMANPFGGRLGRSEPLLIEDGTLVSSVNDVMLKFHMDVALGKRDSLADAPQFQAAVEVISSDGILLQANFVDGQVIAQVPVFSPVYATLLLGSNSTTDEVKQFFRDLLTDFQEIPQYQLLGFADVASQSEQIGKVVLIYTNQADAKIAADVVSQRIDTYMSIPSKRSFKERLADLNVTNPQIEVVETKGMFVVLVTFATRKATNEELQAFVKAGAEEPDVTEPGAVYGLLLDMLFRKDIGWLSTVPRSVIEDMAG